MEARIMAAGRLLSAALAQLVNDWNRLVPIPAWGAVAAVVVLFWLVRPLRVARFRAYAASHQAPASWWMREFAVYAVGISLLYAIVRWKHLI